MKQKMAHELNNADEEILKHLLRGRNAPVNIATKLDYSRQYIQNRLSIMNAADYVRNIGGGIYEITDDGREQLTPPEESLAALHKQISEARTYLDAAEFLCINEDRMGVLDNVREARVKLEQIDDE